MQFPRTQKDLTVVIAMRNILVIVSPVTLSTSVATITHAAITLLVIIPRVAATEPVVTDLLAAVVYVLT